MRSPVRVGVLQVVFAALLGVPAMAQSPYGGPWVWPLDGPRTVSRPFDPPATTYGGGHRGADLPGRPGQLVHAAGAGRISYAGLLAGRGVVVVVHGELRTTYEPVTAVVRVGQQVAAGAVIGRLTPGHAGCAGTCLHWGLLRGSVYLDPVHLVRAGPVRLLPLDRPVGTLLPTVAPAPVGQLRRAAPLAAPSAAPRPAVQPSFALRAADVGWAGTALVALVAGLVLLHRPRRPPDGPAAPGLSAMPAVPTAGAPSSALPPLVDLTAERSRRRPGVA